jgi:uncharacterized phage-associated protein
MSTQHPTMSQEDLILYILNRLEPEKSDKIRLNKLAFFTEFAHLTKFDCDLSSAKYAAIDNGPVIDDYDKILKAMEKNGLVTVDGYIIRPLKSPSAEIPENTRAFVDKIIDKYSKLTNNELITLSHATDSYKITTNNEREMGKIIDKKLASLETFLADDNDSVQSNEDELLKVDRSRLIRYATSR